MTFGWEGFSFDHPEDWAPVTISGNRSQGYARIASPGRLIIQVRWKSLKRDADADRFLDAYLGKLSKDAGGAFQSDRAVADGKTHYEYSGVGYGKGALFKSGSDSRAFVLEVSSSKNDSVNGVIRDALRTFQTANERDRWSCYGLDVSLPLGLEVAKREFLAGKTRCEFTGRHVDITAERWGFADQLLARYGIEDWGRAILADKVDAVDTSACGLRYSMRAPRNGVHEALVAHQPERNQLVVVRSKSRDLKWRPEWDWLN